MALNRRWAFCALALLAGACRTDNIPYDDDWNYADGGGRGGGGSTTTGGGSGGSGGSGGGTVSTAGGNGHAGGTAGTGGGTGAGTAGGAAGGMVNPTKKPNLMIVLDKSGSMNQPLAGGTNCGTCTFPTCNESTCPTRMGAMRRAMSTFLTVNGRSARMGLTVFPADTVCTAAGSSQVLATPTPVSDTEVDLQAWSDSVNNKIQAQTPAGGTPTAASLEFVATLADMNTTLRDDFVLLVTDGLPNCNASNPNSCTSAATQCRCTLTPNCGTTSSDMFCRLGCLDDSPAIQAVNTLRNKQIRTIVLGFGSDFTAGGDGYTVLNSMAAAGGAARACPGGTDAECGGTTCLTNHTCAQGFYGATSATELAVALTQIAKVLSP